MPHELLYVRYLLSCLQIVGPNALEIRKFVSGVWMLKEQNPNTFFIIKNILNIYEK